MSKELTANKSTAIARTDWQPQDAFSVATFSDYIGDTRRPTIGALCRTEGEKRTTFALLVQQFEAFVTNTALEKKIPAGAIQEAALAIIDRYKHLKLEDWVHFLRLCQTGEYGPFVHGNVVEVMDKWKAHIENRLTYAAKQSQGSHEALKEEERKVIDEKIHKGYNQLIMEAAYRKEAEGEYNKYLKTMRALGVPAREAREQKKLQHFITKIAEADKWERGKQRWERLREHREKVQKFTEKHAV